MPRYWSKITRSSLTVVGSQLLNAVFCHVMQITSARDCLR